MRWSNIFLKASFVQPMIILGLFLLLLPPDLAEAKARPLKPPKFTPSGTTKFPFSDAVRAGDFIFLSGQIGKIKDSSPDAFDGAVKKAMDNVGKILAAHNSGFADLVRCSVFLRDMADWPAFNAIYSGYFKPGRYPARSAFGAAGLAAGAALEVECTAYSPRRR